MASSGFLSSRRPPEMQSSRGEAGLELPHPSKPAWVSQPTPWSSHLGTPCGTQKGHVRGGGLRGEGREAPVAPEARTARSWWANSFLSGASVPTSPILPRGAPSLAPRSPQLAQLNGEGTALKGGTGPWGFFKGSSLWQQAAGFLLLSPT